MSSPPSSLSSFSSMDSPPPTLPRTPVKRAASPSFSDQPETSPILTHQHSHPNFSDISSDTFGSVPGSPMEAEELEHAEQVTMCKWDGCDMDMGNMDDLVKHIHEEHIGLRRAKYACEWDDCNRKGMAHASGYALRAHMRSHTKEKPFYCTLPECDRSFTRSDALAKHMRTVHETEALRPSDPIPKSHPNHPQNIHQPNTTAIPHSTASSPSSPTSSTKNTSKNGASKWYTSEDGFDPDEEAMAPRELVKLLKRKLAWAEQEQEELRHKLEELEKKRREGWVKKEMLLDRVLAAELGEEEAAKLSLDVPVGDA
ncbi:hypothetical protein C7212DRAFT_352039 [Tuber magnatum]|uniref:C2H2-type domain-containing protein n=1 Tax=Tuber magnatum TaxID=42249 RepID=A0A317SPL0_9PEZI|nr:hypothetical protein C7212DRAFT_352039 [Tuber magnatum]